MDGDGRILRQPIDMPAVATADPTAAEAASPRRVHNDTHSALPTRVTMVINEFSKRGGNLSRTAAVWLYCRHSSRTPPSVAALKKAKLKLPSGWC